MRNFIALNFQPNICEALGWHVGAKCHTYVRFWHHIQLPLNLPTQGSAPRLTQRLGLRQHQLGGLLLLVGRVLVLAQDAFDQQP